MAAHVARASLVGRAVARLLALAAKWGGRRPFYVVGLALLLMGSSSAVHAAEPALLDAAERGDRAAVLRLLATGMDPNVAGPDGTTPIMWAAANGDVELVQALVKAGADVKAKNAFGTSALTEAAILGSAQVIDVLLRAGAAPDSRNP
jgi:hypothetical protein